MTVNPRRRLRTKQITKSHQANIRELMNFVRRLESDLINSPPQDPLKIRTDDRRGIVIQLPEGVMFDSGSVVPRQSAFPILRELAFVIIKLGNYDVQVAGHTDSSARPNDSNWMMGARRAINVLEYLIELDVEGRSIPPDRISAVTYGSTKPRADNGTPENRALNRRVEIILREPIEIDRFND